MASSLTGTKTIAPRPSMGINLFRYSFSIRGMRYARVLPDPVRLAAMTSRPARAWGTTHRCTSVILTNFLLLSPLRVSEDTGRSEKLILNF